MQAAAPRSPRLPSDRANPRICWFPWVSSGNCCFPPDSGPTIWALAAEPETPEDAVPDPREIHIHLTAQPGTTVHVTIAGDDDSVTSPEAQDEEATSWDEVLEAA